MNYMFTICTKHDIGFLRTMILKLMGITFVNNYRKKVGNGNEWKNNIMPRRIKRWVKKKRQ